MKRPGIITIVLLLLFLSMPLSALGNETNNNIVETTNTNDEKDVLVSAYGYSKREQAGVPEKTELYAFVSQNDEILNIDESDTFSIVIDGENPENRTIGSSTLTDPVVSTFMFLIDESQFMEEHLNDIKTIISSITLTYHDGFFFFWGSDVENINGSVNSKDGLDLSSLKWKGNEDFNKSIGKSIEWLSENVMKSDSNLGWIPGSATHLILFTGNDSGYLSKAKDVVETHPEIIVHTVLWGDNNNNVDQIFSGCTFSNTTASDIFNYLKNLKLIKADLEESLDSFSLQLKDREKNWSTNIIQNVSILNKPQQASDSTSNESQDIIGLQPDNQASGNGMTNEDGSEERSGEGSTVASGNGGEQKQEEDKAPIPSTEETDKVEQKNGNADGNPGGLDSKVIIGIVCGALVLIAVLAVLIKTMSNHDRDEVGYDYRDIGRKDRENGGIPMASSSRTNQQHPDAQGIKARRENDTITPAAEKNGQAGRKNMPSYTARGSSRSVKGNRVVAPPANLPPVTIRIEEIEGRFIGKGTVFTFKQELVAGSDPKCDLVFSDRGVSPRHSRIFRSNGQLFIEDLGSDEGTYLDGMRLFSQNPLRDGDAIGIGDAGFVVRL